MNTLHTINRSGELALCKTLLLEGDSLLFLEDGVYDLLSDQLPDKAAIYAIEDDIRTRGLVGRLPATVSCVDYSGYVRLVCEHDKLVNWI